MNNSVWEKRRKRLFELIEIGSNYDAWCWGYDFFNTFTILLNLTVSIMYTFDNMEMKYGPAPSDAGAPDGCFLCY